MSTSQWISSEVNSCPALSNKMQKYSMSINCWNVAFESNVISSTVDSCKLYSICLSCARAIHRSYAWQLSVEGALVLLRAVNAFRSFSSFRAFRPPFLSPESWKYRLMASSTSRAVTINVCGFLCTAPIIKIKQCLTQLKRTQQCS